jgi:hypothetical protein
MNHNVRVTETVEAGIVAEGITTRSVRRAPGARGAHRGAALLG